MGLGIWDYSFFQDSRFIWFPLAQEQKVQPAVKILRFTVPVNPKLTNMESVMLQKRGKGTEIVRKDERKRWCLCKVTLNASKASKDP